MATISTDTYLDGGVARTAGEAWTINSGATLTIRTDTRWHANAPASMTGTLGTLTCSTTQGGTLKVDATKVRWMAFDTGSGTVPAIGTTITQGGITGYLLGVWADYVSAPVAVGTAMPASGYMKFREVTGGPYSAGALTGISANATSADVTGWIEVVWDAASSANLSLNALGNLVTTGDWFYLGTTSGSRQQAVSIPINGGTTAYIHGVQIETSPGSNIYDWYFTGTSSALFTTANLAQDIRSKGVCSNGTTFIIGGDGTNSMAYLPAAGCKIRIPNIFLRVATTAARATNVWPDYTSFTIGNNCRFGSTGFSLASIDYVNAVWDFNNFSNCGTVTISNSAIGGPFNRFSNVLNGVTVSNSFFGHHQKNGSSGGLSNIRFDACSNVTVSNSACLQLATNTQNAQPHMVYKCNNVSISNYNIYSLLYDTTDQRDALVFDGCDNVNAYNINIIGGALNIQNCTNSTFTNTDYIWDSKGDTNVSSTQRQRYAIMLQNCANTTVNGLSFGLNGTIANTHPYTGVIQINGTTGKNVVRNIGTRSSFVATGTNATYYPASIVRIEAGSSNIKLQRIYGTQVRNNVVEFGSQAACSNLLLEHVYTNYAKSLQLQTKNSVFRNIGATVVTSGGVTTGNHWIDYFTADTLGALEWLAIAPSTSTAGENYIYTTGTSKYTPSTTQVILNTVGDYFYAEMTYFVIGHTSLRNLAPTITGTNTNLVTFEYQIDAGTGFGSWKTLNATNLTGETITASTGFKLKLRGTLTSSGIAQITSIQVFTNSTAADQAANLYVLDTAQLSFTGLIPSSEVRCYSGTNPATSIEIGGTEATGGSTFSFSHSSGGTDGYIVILAMGYQPIYLPYTFKTTDDSILIQPVIDRNYYNPV